MAEQKAPVTLVNNGTLLDIGARAPHSSAPDRAQWTINRPPFIRDTGRCYLVVQCKDGVYTVAIGRQGMCADIYTEASAGQLLESDVDRTVSKLWRDGSV